jgi:hypothetical protein
VFYDSCHIPNRKKCLRTHKLVIIIIIIINHYIYFKQNVVCPSEFLACYLRRAWQSFALPRQRMRSQDCPTLEYFPFYALLSPLETRTVVKWHFILPIAPSNVEELDSIGLRVTNTLNLADLNPQEGHIFR